MAYGAKHVIRNLKLDKTCLLLNEDSLRNLDMKLKKE